MAWKRPLEYSLWMKIVNMHLNKSLLARKRPLEYSLWMRIKIVNMHLNKMRLRDMVHHFPQLATFEMINYESTTLLKPSLFC
jgi:hypothetical protein